MVKNITSNVSKEKIVVWFQATGLFLFLIGIVAMLGDILLYMPLYVKSFLLFVLALSIIFFSNALEE